MDNSRFLTANIKLYAQKKSQMWAAGAPWWLHRVLHFHSAFLGQHVGELAKRKFCSHLKSFLWTSPFPWILWWPSALATQLLVLGLPQPSPAFLRCRDSDAVSSYLLAASGSLGHFLRVARPAHSAVWKNSEKCEKEACVRCLGIEHPWVLISIRWHCDLIFVFIFLHSPALLQEVRM